MSTTRGGGALRAANDVHRDQHAGRAPALALALCAGAALAACGSGSSGFSGPPQGPFGGGGPSFGEDGGDPAPPLSTGATVTWLETQLAGLDTFVLRGTIPVTPGTYPRSDGLQPFTIYDFDGTPLETQTEVVSRFANAADGADVVEVVARVRKDPLLAADDYARYRVRQSPRPAGPVAGTPGIEDLNAPQVTTPNVQTLLANATGIEIATYDVYGNKYVCHPLDGSGSKRLLRHGRVQSTLRVYQDMVPVSPNSTTLPHLFGVHAYISTIRGDDLIGLDLRFHNGHSGNDSSTAMDDPMDRIYFTRIDVTVPDNWFVDQDYEDPFFGAEFGSGGKRTVSLVNPNPDGTLHTMRWQGQMHRRLMLSTSGLRATGAEYLSNGAGQGFCVRGVDPDDGHEYWSWWNRGTARYWPQRYQLPSLDHVGMTGLRNTEKTAFDGLRGHLVNGTNTANNYPISRGNLGWAHPYGVPYGGMTGGNEVFVFDGVKTACTASRWSAQAFKITHRMHTDRMPNVLYDADGSPSSVEDWVVGGSYVPFQHYVVPSFSGGVDPFGLKSAPQFQIQQVAGTGRKPAYEAELSLFDPHDYQHYIRYTRSAKVLAWLTNDPLARDDLEMAAEMFRLGYHEYDNSQYGSVQQTGLKQDQLETSARGPIGMGFGRGEAWGIDAAAAAYALGDDAWRGKTLPWFRKVANVLNDGQAACSGFIQSNVTPKNLSGLYRTRQMIEQSITENTIQGMRETVFRGADNAYADMMRDVLRDSLYGFISDMCFVGKNVPPSITALGPVDITLPVWCSFAQMPSGSWSPYNEGYQNWSSFAYGYELTGDTAFLDRADGQTGSSAALFTQMMNYGTNNLENRAALLALVQRMNGVL
jgi:hypothetical protein